jgi:hypothetical protein
MPTKSGPANTMFQPFVSFNNCTSFPLGKGVPFLGRGTCVFSTCGCIISGCEEASAAPPRSYVAQICSTRTSVELEFPNGSDGTGSGLLSIGWAGLSTAACACATWEAP